MDRKTLIFALLAGLACAFPIIAAEDPRIVRHELMEEVGEGAEAVAGMLKGEREFDAQVVMNALETWREAASKFGELFPEGTESGEKTEAKITIWTDREGFEARLASFRDEVDAAIAAEPQQLDELKTVAQPVFDNCKKCHEDYRIEEEE